MAASPQLILNFIQESQYNLSESFCEQLSLGMAVFDRDLILKDCNATWVELLKRYTPLSADQLTPGIYLFNQLPEVEATLRPLFEQALGGRQARVKELRLTTETAVSYWDVVLTPTEEKAQDGIILGMLDITERMAAHQELANQAVNLATLEERDWLARELHDNIAHALGYMNLQIAVINEALVGGEIGDAQATLRELKKIVGETYTDVREEIFNLRATTSLGLGFVDTLRDYLKRYRTHYELNVELVIEVDESALDFPVEVSTQVIRIIQEALINIRKHAGVQQAVIGLRQVDDFVCINVQDQGRGFSLTALDQPDKPGFGSKSGFGLQIMAERAEGAGGYLKIDTAPGQGVNIMVWLPVSPGK
jgi:signal transduction histidine kinase